MEYRIFIASSMQNPCREAASKAIQNVNLKLELFQIHFGRFIYSETPIADGGSNTQQLLDHEAAASDIFIMLVDNNSVIGQYTLGEYQSAAAQSSNSPDRRPQIKVYAIYSKNDAGKSIYYTGPDGSAINFENKLVHDSGRYVEFIEREKFQTTLEEWLINTALAGLEPILRQNELSYGEHLHRIGQGGIRQDDNRYFRRDNLDGRIDSILRTSPVIILEGNTYSGKTRAAFEYMKSCPEWTDYDFHIFDNRHSVRDLNMIRCLDFTGRNRGDVFLFDDINDILSKNNDIIDRLQAPLWVKLNGYNQTRGFSLEDFGKTRIIFTVSGKLSASAKNKLYKDIFHNNSTNIKKIIVDFDIYDSYSFRQMVSAMVRDGVLARADIRPGNYTIGSLFIRTDEIRHKTQEEYNTNAALLLAIVGHFKYASKSRYMGLLDELTGLYDFIRSGGQFDSKEQLQDGIERLRQNGLAVTQNDGCQQYRVFVDRYILDVFNEFVLERLRYKQTNGASALNRMLIDYALASKTLRAEKADDMPHHQVRFVTQMAYLLTDRNQLDDNEITDLIEVVSTALLPDNRYGGGNNDAVIIVRLVDIAGLPGEHPKIFASSAISNLRDFQRVNNLLGTCLRYQKYCTDRSLHDKYLNAVELYKRTVYALLSTGNRVLTMEQEQKLLGRVLDENEKWKEPFGADDLKEVFNLARMASYLRKKTASEIISLLPATTLRGYEYSGMPYISEGSPENPEEEDTDFDKISASVSSDPSPDDEMRAIYEKVFLRKLSNAAALAVRRVDNYKDFVEAVTTLKNVCAASINVLNAVERYFDRDFYSMTADIAQKMNYSDRGRFFNFIFAIDDAKGVLGNLNVKGEYAETRRAYRIHSLNELLAFLDEKTALEDYRKMTEQSLCDMYTSSCLLNNEFLNYEQFLHLIGNGSGHLNFITLNQLMRKAETLSDANICMRLMGILDCDPSKIRDENALANYLQNRYVDSRRCISILKRRRALHPEALSDAIITVVLKKFKISQLTDIFFPCDDNRNEGYYFDKYGLLDAEVARIHRNAQQLSILFTKANIEDGNPETAVMIRQKFTEIISSDELRALISDPECNGNNGILSVYMKNRNLFDSYETTRSFYDSLPEQCKPANVDHHIYGVFLWNIVNDYTNGVYDRKKATGLLNAELTKAYGEFATHYTKPAVVTMMSSLYRYRPCLADESGFDKTEDYAYEDQILHTDFIGYLGHIIRNNFAYVDGTFIFNSLRMMKNGVNEMVYGKLAELASLNHTGVRYDTIFRRDKDTKEPILSPDIQQRLFRLDSASGDFTIDNALVYNVSYIKVLCFLVHNRLITLDQAEEYRRRNNIPVTETYCNFVLKNMEQKAMLEWKRSGFNNRVLEIWYNNMTEYMAGMFSPDVSYIHRSIQMCLSLIAVAPDEEHLARVFTTDGFGEFMAKPEAIGARMNRLVQLRYMDRRAYRTLDEFKEIMLENCRSVNIGIVNTYLSTFVRICRFETATGNDTADTPITRCWQLLLDERKIDVSRLLNLDRTQEDEVVRQLGLEGKGWILDADVQTFSYFSRCTPNLISIMDRSFNGDFTYDDSGRKNCLKDTLKNFAFSYDYHNHMEDTVRSREEIANISEILLRKEHSSVFREICDEYLLRSSRRSRHAGGWVEPNSLWIDLLSCEGFRTAFVKYICEQPDKDTDEKAYKFNKLLSLNENDSVRINMLRNALRRDRLGPELGKIVSGYYNQATRKAATDNNANIVNNNRLIKSVFSLQED